MEAKKLKSFPTLERDIGFTPSLLANFLQEKKLCIHYFYLYFCDKISFIEDSLNNGLRAFVSMTFLYKLYFYYSLSNNVGLLMYLKDSPWTSRLRS